MRIEIDQHSGFCFGVINAIEKAEKELGKNQELYCLGSIVHNQLENERLNSLGLTTINYDEYKNLKNCRVLIRAHGEPPETYKIAKENNLELIDATCPIVLKLQQRIKTACTEMEPVQGQLVIYGKEGHPEVKGLAGQSGGKAIVVKEMNDLENIDFSLPVTLYSQTTMPVKGYQKISAEIKRRMQREQEKENVPFTIKSTICKQVSGREPHLKEFARQFDMVIFVAGKESSNGKLLFQACKEANPHSRFISGPDELDPEWFDGVNSVGISGATSTPAWLMEKTAEKIRTYA